MTDSSSQKEKLVQSVKDFAGRELVWEKPRALRREFELRSGEEVLATLRWSKGWWSTLAEATSAEEQWTFKRSGFWKPKVTARRPGSETDLATFELGWNGAGVLTLTGGATYRWDNEGFWGNAFVWKDPAGNPLVRFHHQMMKNKGEVEVSPSASTLADLPFLIVFGWYLAVSLMEERSAAAGAGGGGGAAGG
jgi:hypothetical protein